MHRNKIKCEKCCLEISRSNYLKHLRRHELHPETFKEATKNLTCRFCGEERKNKRSLSGHERVCKLNKNRKEINTITINGGTINHVRKLARPVRLIVNVNPTIRSNLDITYGELSKYREDHKHCEICGKHVDKLSTESSKSIVKNLCIDHDHNTNKFRGLLCTSCNRNLGWYENNKENVENYLHKTGR